MRILFTNIYYAPWSFGGATIVVENLAKEFFALGHEVHVFSGRPTGSLSYELTHRVVDGIQVHEIRLPHFSRELEFENISVTEVFENLIRTIKPDLVHHHAIQHLGYKIVKVASQHCKVNFVTLHDAWWMCSRQFMLDYFGNYCHQSNGINLQKCITCAIETPHELIQSRAKMLEVLNEVDQIFVPSKFWKNLMIASGASAGKVTVNTNGLNEPLYINYGSHNFVRFGYLGGNSRIKGVDKVIDSFKILKKLMKNNNSQLVMVDNERNNGGITLWPNEIDKVQGVQLIKGFSAKTRDSFYASIDVLLFPSRWDESFGLSVREALQRGVYVIATDSGGVPECFTNSCQGSILNKGCTAEDLALEMLKCITNPPNRSEIVRVTQEASKIVTPNVQAKEVISMYEDLATQI